jgi:cell division protein FtsA
MKLFKFTETTSTVSIAVFENSSPISMQVFSIGSTDITNDIALGLRVSLEEAEGIKRGTSDKDYPKRKLESIIEARLADIFELLENHLKKIKRNALLPAVIIITGGGSHLGLIEELARKQLKLPVKIGTAEYFSQSKIKIKDPSWFIAVGTCVMQKAYIETDTKNQLSKGFGSVRELCKNIFKQLLP